MIYLDNAATTAVSTEVLRAAMPYLIDNYGNAGATYSFGKTSAKAIDKAREQVAELINVNPEQIIFTSGGSEANNLAFTARRRKTYTSGYEHESVLKASGDKSVRFRITDVTPDFIGLELRNCAKCYKRKHNALCAPLNPTLISMMYTNNETGENLPVEETIRKARQCGTPVIFHTDCVQALGSEKLDMKKIGCDMASFSAHKIHGFKGTGALFVKDKSLLTPLIAGGEHQEFGYRAGTENVAGIVAFGAACATIKRDFGMIREREISLINRFKDVLFNELEAKHLLSIAHINGMGTKIINLHFDGVDGETLLLMLDSKGICVSAGSACTAHEQKPSHVLKAMGFSDNVARNSIRVSVSDMNTTDEMETAAIAICNTITKLRGGSFNEWF